MPISQYNKDAKLIISQKCQNQLITKMQNTLHHKDVQLTISQRCQTRHIEGCPWAWEGRPGEAKVKTQDRRHRTEDRGHSVPMKHSPHRLHLVVQEHRSSQKLGGLSAETSHINLHKKYNFIFKTPKDLIFLRHLCKGDINAGWFYRQEIAPRIIFPKMWVLRQCLTPFICIMTGISWPNWNGMEILS